jgi:hypothetical protein
MYMHVVAQLSEAANRVMVLLLLDFWTIESFPTWPCCFKISRVEEEGRRSIYARQFVLELAKRPLSQHLSLKPLFLKTREKKSFMSIFSYLEQRSKG